MFLDSDTVGFEFGLVLRNKYGQWSGKGFGSKVGRESFEVGSEDKIYLFVLFTSARDKIFLFLI